MFQAVEVNNCFGASDTTFFRTYSFSLFFLKAVSAKLETLCFLRLRRSSKEFFERYRLDWGKISSSSVYQNVSIFETLIIQSFFRKELEKFV